MRPTPPRSLKRIAAIGVCLIAVSVAGYMWIEGYSLVDAVYMTVLALSTVGFGEVRPLSPAGRIFTVGVIVVGVSTGAYLFGTLAEYIVAGELAGTLRQRRIMGMIERLRDHYVICGYGRVGEQVATELLALNLPLVVVDRDPAVGERLEQRKLPFVLGNATEDGVLKQAGIERARGLLAVLNDDADNVFVTLSARALNRDLIIVARATFASAEGKLRKAGADRVVSPYIMAGHRMVSLLVQPNVVDFLDAAMYTAEFELWLEEILVAPDSPLVGKPLVDADIRARTGANILAILRGSARRPVGWSPQSQFAADDILVVMGLTDQLKALAQIAGDTRPLRPYRLRELLKSAEPED